MRALAVTFVAAAVVAVTPTASGRSDARPSVTQVRWAPGPSIAFTRGNDIGSVGAFVYAGPATRRLARFGVDPVWSPDGQRLALGYKDGIAVVRPDGSGLQTIQRNVVEPSWSPDGRWIAFFFILREGVGIMRADGSGVRQVGILHSDAPDRIAWSPDSRQLAFGAQDKGFFVVPIDGSHRQRPRRACPEWGPKGELVYAGRGFITIVRSDGSKRRIGLNECPVWSPDGRKLAANGSSRPMLADARSGRVWPAQVPPREDTRTELAWSPDGRRLAFSWPAGAGANALYGLYTVGSHGGSPRRLLRR